MTRSYSKIVSTILVIVAELNRRETIPSEYLESLEERLIITFKTIKPLQRRLKRRTAKEIKVQFQHKNAHRIYKNILDESPQIYLPFILAVQPSACISFDLSTFQRDFEWRSLDLPSIRLHSNARQLFTTLSQKNNFGENTLYKKLIRFLFPQDVCSPLQHSIRKPVSAADGDARFTYAMAHANSVRAIFGEYIYGAVEDSPARKREKLNQMIETTQCVNTSFAQHDFKDGVVCLDIWRADEIARRLFPHVRLTQPEEHRNEFTKDNAHFTLLGASVPAISSILPSKIYEAIDNSNLRAWERENHLLETTDCLTMRISREDFRCGTINVRIGYIAGFPILCELCR